MNMLSVMLLGCVTAFVSSPAQDDFCWENVESAAERYKSLYRQHHENPEALWAQGVEMMKQAAAQGRCRQWMAGAALASTANPHAPFPDFPFDSCDWRFPEYHYQSGVSCYLNGEPDLALAAFAKSLQFGLDSATALTAIGTLQFELDSLEAAAISFEKAWESLDLIQPSHLMLLNNLGAVHLISGQPREALRWIRISQEQVRNDEWPAEVTKRYTDQQNYNEVSALCMLGEVEEVSRLAAQLNWGVANVRAVDWLKLYVNVAHLTRSWRFVDQNWAASQLWAASLTKAELEESLGAFAPLFSKEIEQLTPDEIRHLWKEAFEVRSLTQESNGGQQETRGLHKEWRFLLLLGMSLLTVCIFAWIWSRRAVWFGAGPREIQRNLKILRKGDQIRFAKAWRLNHAGLVLKSALLANHVKAPDGVQLTASEEIVYKASARMVSPKQVARDAGWTPAYVYFLRSKLRAKLGALPEDDVQE